MLFVSSVPFTEFRESFNFSYHLTDVYPAFFLSDTKCDSTDMGH